MGRARVPSKALVSLVRAELWQSATMSCSTASEGANPAQLWFYILVFGFFFFEMEFEKRLPKPLWCCRIYFWSSTKVNKGSNLSYLFGCRLAGTDSAAASAGERERERGWWKKGWREGGRKRGREKTQLAVHFSKSASEWVKSHRSKVTSIIVSVATSIFQQSLITAPPDWCGP